MNCLQKLNISSRHNLSYRCHPLYRDTYSIVSPGSCQTLSSVHIITVHMDCGPHTCSQILLDSWGSWPGVAHWTDSLHIRSSERVENTEQWGPSPPSKTSAITWSQRVKGHILVEEVKSESSPVSILVWVSSHTDLATIKSWTMVPGGGQTIKAIQVRGGEGGLGGGEKIQHVHWPGSRDSGTKSHICPTWARPAWTPEYRHGTVRVCLLVHPPAAGLIWRNDTVDCHHWVWSSESSENKGNQVRTRWEPERTDPTVLTSLHSTCRRFSKYSPGARIFDKVLLC